MLSSVIPARLVFQCGHAALVSLPRVKGETPSQRADRVAREKSAALLRACDFCAQRLEVVVQQAAPATPPASLTTPTVERIRAVDGEDIGRGAPEPAVSSPAPAPALAAAAAPVAPVPAPAQPVPPVVTKRPSHRRNGSPPVKPPQAAVASVPAAAVASPPPAEISPAKVTDVVAVSAAQPPSLPRPKTPARRARGDRTVGKGVGFTVEFQVSTVLYAASVVDALRQAQSLGATEVLAIVRES